MVRIFSLFYAFSVITSVTRADKRVAGNALGGMYGCVNAYEDILSSMPFTNCV